MRKVLTTPFGRTYVCDRIGRFSRGPTDRRYQEIYEVRVDGVLAGRVGEVPWYGESRKWVTQIRQLTWLVREENLPQFPEHGSGVSHDAGPFPDLQAAFAHFVRAAEWMLAMQGQ
jgi:hypothetical protein